MWRDFNKVLRVFLPLSRKKIFFYKTCKLKERKYSQNILFKIVAFSLYFA